MKKLLHTILILLLPVFSSWIGAQDLNHPAGNPSIADSNKPMAEPEMVKIYVKQDPASYKKQNDGNAKIDFSVQVSATSQAVSEKSARTEWEGLGPVYVQKENGMFKIRIGPYETQKEAKEVLLEVKSKGRKDAFIVVRQQGTDYDKPIAKEKAMETATQPVSESNHVMTADEYPEGEYKVRIASYLQPGGFNPEGVDQLGKLESYRKGEWTIMMIGGFKSIQAAEQARKVVISKGFNDAAVVVDRNGILETVIE